MSNASPDHAVVDRETWLAARLAHLADEKEFTRRRDELSAQRRALPWLQIEQDYTFVGPDGEMSLTDLFDGCTQLLVYHFMLGPDWVEGCPSCSFWADNYDGLAVHLRHRDTALTAISRAPFEEIEAYRERMDWSFPWVSSNGSSFNFDIGVSFPADQIEAGEANYNFGTQVFGGEEAAGVSIFTRDAESNIYLSYQTFSRGLDMLNTAYHMLDLTPKGRDEDSLPWGMAWLHRHDAYPAD